MLLLLIHYYAADCFSTTTLASWLFELLTAATNKCRWAVLRQIAQLSQSVPWNVHFDRLTTVFMQLFNENRHINACVARFPGAGWSCSDLFLHTELIGCCQNMRRSHVVKSRSLAVVRFFIDFFYSNSFFLIFFSDVIFIANIYSRFFF